MTKKGGKLNQGMKDWLAFVDKVKLEEKIDHREAIMRAKARKDGGEEWRTSGGEKEVVSKDPEVEAKDDNKAKAKAKDESDTVDEATVATSAGESDEVIPPSNEESNNGGKKGGKKTNKKQKVGKKTSKNQKGGKKTNKKQKSDKKTNKSKRAIRNLISNILL
jgi:hypothetical protein